jgi:hypothetical protein
MRDERLPEHFAGDFAHLIDRRADMHSAFEAAREPALAASARVNLRLHDKFLRAEFFGGGGGFVGGAGDRAAGGGDAKFFKEFASLVFVDVHVKKWAGLSGGARGVCEEASRRVAVRL